MSGALSNADRQGAEWAVLVAGSSITDEPIETILRKCLAANAKEPASSEPAMHASLMSGIASFVADSFVHFAKDIPRGAANLYDDGALSPANVAQLANTGWGICEGRPGR